MATSSRRYKRNIVDWSPACDAVIKEPREHIALLEAQIGTQ